MLLKVVTLNHLYGTGILATSKVAEHIYHLNIDSKIHNGQPEAVHLIAKVQLGKQIRNNYSFATKYCAWHNPNGFPIYDNYVDQMLWGYAKQDHFEPFKRLDLWNYGSFQKIILRFLDYYNLVSI